MPEQKPLLEIANLRKVYKNTVAVDDVSLKIYPGDCLGLLGPNGAGKTTTIEIIEDIIEPTSGQILYRGEQRKSSFKEEVGIQFQHTSLLNFLSVKETLRTFAKLFTDPEDFDILVSRCELGPLLERRNNKLSGGQQQRLMLALALINRPRLVFLDEPSTGLDPQSRRNLWSIVEQIKDEGKTIILTTHSMEEAEHLCERIAIMDQGRIIAEGSPDGLIREHCGTNSIFLPAVAPTDVPPAFPYPWHQEKRGVRIECADIHEAIGHLSRMNVALSGLSISSANLEDVFLQLTGKQLRD
ncbi:ABC transporter ATP-binding protein [Desulfopila inferna]|uniref:ABC transporter ATP-binding protein n=1 Tax=Desulfopila inferna TaxID=468528 RepID=UPI0019653BC4|nr:ABC transporter ATP-binding protein [Desulfopila inferna]MBM9604791.1 ABC transporter ATP-binding protein [Desulfopila inferna]